LSTYYPDDNFIPKINNNPASLVEYTKRAPEAITKWLKQSGLKVNNTKEDLYLFYKHDTTSISIRIVTKVFSSSKNLNVLEDNI
jgi:hypothetical protein